MTCRPSLPALLARLLAACLLLLAVAAPVAAVDGPIRLRDAVTDQAGVLTAAEEAELTAELERVRADAGVQVFAAFIDSSGADDINTWTEDTVTVSSLGGNDALIVVAIDDRTYSMWVSSTLGFTDAEIDRILVDHLEGGLMAGDYVGAVADAARATGEVATGGGEPTRAPATPVSQTAAPTAVPGGTGSGSGGSGGGINVTLILVVLLIVGGGLLVLRMILARRRASATQAASLDQLNVDANRALLTADEELKDAVNDVDFAAAQWGDEEVVPYREAIRQATEELRAAFAVRQRLDDAQPETPAQRDQLLREIVARCTRAQELLEVQEQRFDDLQDLQEAAPEQLSALPAAIAALAARHGAATATLARLESAYALSALASVDGNLAEAGKAIESARAEAAAGSGAVTTRPADGVIALRRAQEAIARATQLVEAVERLAASLDEAASRLPGELQAAATDLAAARDAVARLAQVPAMPPAAPGAPAAADPAAALRAAESALADAQQAAAARPPDPLAALQAAMTANQAADAITARAADAHAQVARRRQVAEAAIATAQGHVTRAVDFITTRRHGVGETARTRAAEAEMRLDEARRLLADDPEGATAGANRALALADEAYRLAAGEFGRWNRGAGPVAGPYAPPGDGGQVMGAILGGMLGGMIGGAAARGGRQGSGWGGSPWGTSRPGPSRGGFGATRRPSGSGGRTRSGGFSRPSGGGSRPSGGGGRVRGGRW